MLICLFPVAFWAFFKFKLEHVDPNWNITHFWYWNIFAFVMQMIFISGEVISFVDRGKNPKPEKAIEGGQDKQRVKNE